MNVLDNVERIAAPPAEVFYRDYVLARRPVILTDLFDACAIRALDTAAKVRERLPNLPITVQPNYMTALLAQGRTGEVLQTTLGEFLDQLERDPDTDDYCVEYPTPRAMRELIAPTEHCRLGEESDLLSLMFVAASGNFAQLHYDGDQRHVLMYQAFGRKRYVIIDPAEGGKLAPLAGRNIQRTSAILLQNFSEDDKRAFLEYTNAWDCVLQPGETLFMPLMAWHYIEYLDVSMSVSYRLGRNPYNRFLAEAVPIPSVFLQRLAIQFADETAVDGERREVFRRLQQASTAPYASEAMRARALDRFCMEACDSLDPASSVLYTTLDHERREQLVREAAAGPESPRSATGDGSPPAWLDDDPVMLRPDVMLVRPLSDEVAATRSVFLLRNGQLETELTLDERMQWLLDALKMLSSASTMSPVAELSERCDADAVCMRKALSQLYERGWLASPASLIEQPNVHIVALPQVSGSASELEILLRQGENEQSVPKKALLSYLAIEEVNRAGIRVASEEIEAVSREVSRYLGLDNKDIVKCHIVSTGLDLEIYSALIRSFAAVLKLEKLYASRLEPLIVAHHHIATMRPGRLT